MFVTWSVGADVMMSAAQETQIKNTFVLKHVAAIAQWIRPGLPFCSAGFESLAHHQRFCSQFWYFICHCIKKKYIYKTLIGGGRGLDTKGFVTGCLLSLLSN